MDTHWRGGADSTDGGIEKSGHYGQRRGDCSEH